MPPSPLDPGEKLYCVSYAPFRGRRPRSISPPDRARQIDEDLGQLAKITDCVRIYSVDFGLDQLPEIAQRHGLKVLLGLWVSSHRRPHAIPDHHRHCARQPVSRRRARGDRRQRSAAARRGFGRRRLREYDRSVKSQVKMPVTYADVWEFWLRNRELAGAVDFVTVHILPYWEDDPIAAAKAANHVAFHPQARGRENFPGKEIVIGEFGWPSAGRMRDGALPSPANQARVIRRRARARQAGGFPRQPDRGVRSAVEALSGRHGRRTLGHVRRRVAAAEIRLGRAGVQPSALAVAGGGRRCARGLGVRRGDVGAAALRSDRRAGADARPWIAIALNAAVAGVLVGWTVENIPLESLGFGGWTRSLAFAALAIAGADRRRGGACHSRRTCRRFISVDRLESRSARPIRWRSRSGCCLSRLWRSGGAVGARAVVRSALSRFSVCADDGGGRAVRCDRACWRRVPPGRGRPRKAGAAVLALCAIFIAWNETLANWQALWFAATLAALAFSLLGRGSRQAEDQHRDGKRRQRHVVEHDAGAGGERARWRTDMNDGRISSSTAAPSATIPNTCGVKQRNRGAAAGAEPAFDARVSQAMPMAELLDHAVAHDKAIGERGERDDGKAMRPGAGWGGRAAGSCRAA